MSAGETPGGRRIARLSLGAADPREVARQVFVELAGGRAHVLDGAPWAGGIRTGEVVEGVDAEGRPASPGKERLAPVTPSKILCVGRNYRAHAHELGHDVPAEPLLFLKPPSSLLDPDGAIELPPPSVSTRIEHEAELAVVIGRRARRVSREAAPGHVFGLTVAGDITARDLQKKDGQWTRAKGMDTFCPVGPVIVDLPVAVPLRIECRVNGEVRQDGTTADMIFPIAEVIAYASRFLTLEPGDLLLTGTPSGVGPLLAGDELTIRIAEIGTLRASVVAGPA
jgi:2-keto-4-pentenoate hydratase/2-oxohepta-3-ene-1,7-dioic acid hydratase in catechol pathway